MDKFVHLIGAEDVKNAGHNMQSAAESMRYTASHFQEAFQMHERFMTEWLDRFERIVEEMVGGEKETK